LRLSRAEQSRAASNRLGRRSQGGRAGQGTQGTAGQRSSSRAEITEQGRALHSYRLLGCSQLRLGRLLSLTRLLALSWVSSEQLHVRQLFSLFFSHHFQHLCTSKFEFNTALQQRGGRGGGEPQDQNDFTGIVQTKCTVLCDVQWRHGVLLRVSIGPCIRISWF